MFGQSPCIYFYVYPHIARFLYSVCLSHSHGKCIIYIVWFAYYDCSCTRHDDNAYNRLQRKHAHHVSSLHSRSCYILYYLLYNNIESTRFLSSCGAEIKYEQILVHTPAALITVITIRLNHHYLLQQYYTHPYMGAFCTHANLYGRGCQSLRYII